MKRERVLVVLWVVLAGLWWGMPVRIGEESIGYRVSMWIAGLGWDKGPPSEYAYDFIFSWHVTASILAFLWIIRSGRAGGLSKSTIKVMLLYPVVCYLIILVYPWDEEGAVMGKILGIPIYIALFTALTILGQRFQGRRWAQRMVMVFYLVMALMEAVGPVTGNGLLIIITAGCGMIALGVAAAAESRWIRSARPHFI